MGWSMVWGHRIARSQGNQQNQSLVLLVWRHMAMIPLRLRLRALRNPLPTEQCSTYIPVTKPLYLNDIEPQAKKDDAHMSHIAPICKSLSHPDIFWGVKRERRMVIQQMEGQNVDRWTQGKSQEADQHSLPNWLSDPGSWPCKWCENVKGKEVMEWWWSMMIKPLIPNTWSCMGVDGPCAYISLSLADSPSNFLMQVTPW